MLISETQLKDVWFKEIQLSGVSQAMEKNGVCVFHYRSVCAPCHQEPAISCAFGARHVLHVFLFTAENMKGLSRLPLNFFAQHYWKLVMMEVTSKQPEKKNSQWTTATGKLLFFSVQISSTHLSTLNNFLLFRTRLLNKSGGKKNKTNKQTALLKS